jgi:hypothetical protein
MEMRIECADAHSGALQGAFQRAVNARATCDEVFAGVGKSVARIVVHDSSGEFAYMTLLLAQLAADRVFLTKGQIVEPLGETAQQRGDARFGAAYGQTSQALPRLEELKAGRTFQSVSLIGQTLGNLVLGLGDELGGG